MQVNVHVSDPENALSDDKKGLCLLFKVRTLIDIQKTRTCLSFQVDIFCISRVNM